MYDKEGNLSPSTFIPFCAFGKNMTSIGFRKKGFDLPICTGFQSVILNDQLCYEVDLEKYKNRNNLKDDLETGLAFFMDYNEDRQVKLGYKGSGHVMHEDLVGKVDAHKDDKNAIIYLNTIGWLDTIICNIYDIIEFN